MELLFLAIMARTLQVYAHNAHNNASGVTFQQDHEFFGEVYSKAEGFYDSLVERYIGTSNEDIDSKAIIKLVDESLNKLPMEASNEVFYREILKLIKEFNANAEKISKMPNMSIGINNLLAGQVDELEVVIYKINRRLK